MASRELDLFNMIRHAYISGAQWKGATITEAIGSFLGYQPEECPAYGRLCMALNCDDGDCDMAMVKYSSFDSKNGIR